MGTEERRHSCRRWSRGHKARGQGQGRKKKTKAKDNPLEAKDLGVKDTSASVPKKKRSLKNFIRRSQKKRSLKVFFWRSQKKRSSKNFFRRSVKERILKFFFRRSTKFQQLKKKCCPRAEDKPIFEDLRPRG